MSKPVDKDMYCPECGDDLILLIDFVVCNRCDWSYPSTVKEKKDE